MESLTAVLDKTPIIPVLVIEDADRAVPVAEALVAGGLSIVEITLRTAVALDCIRRVSAAVPTAIVGAGTVLSAEHARSAIDAGSRFLVSPGLSDPVIDVAAGAGTPIIPGVATASEVQHAWNRGLRVLKFFPAGQAGGVPLLKALGSVFRDVRFVPTGGVSAANLTDYLSVPSVVACGGSWLTPAAAIAAADYATITELAAEAVRIAREVRP